MRCLLVSIILVISARLYSQERPPTFLSADKTNEITQQFTKLTNKLTSNSQKTLLRFRKEEQRMLRKLKKRDSSLAVKFSNSSAEFTGTLQKRMQQASDSSHSVELKEYFPNLDSLSGAVAFIDQHAGNNSTELQTASASIKKFSSQLQLSNEIKKQLRERRQMLKQQLEKFGMVKEMKRINKQVFYYQQQLNEYKGLLKDPKKMQQKLVAKLRDLPAFQSFIKKNGMLAKLLRLPDNYGSTESLAGLQTRASVQAQLTQRFSGVGINPQQRINDQLGVAQAELNKLKNKLKQFGGSSSNLEMPEGFTPNSQKTKRFLQRFELGFNLQTQQPNGYFPVTADIATTIGYKLNDQSVIGVGASYKLGMGSGFKNLKLTHEGIGLRSYVDVKIKKSFWMTGGYEQDYNQRFEDLNQLADQSLWRAKALLGVTKKVKVGKKKGTNVQLLYDFLHNQNALHTKPFLFRVGWTF